MQRTIGRCERSLLENADLNRPDHRLNHVDAGRCEPAMGNVAQAMAQIMGNFVMILKDDLGIRQQIMIFGRQNRFKQSRKQGRHEL